MAQAVDPVTLHRDALIVDGLNFFADGDASPLRAANISAVNLTVSHMEADFEAATDQLSEWLRRLAQPDCGWRLVESTADFAAAREEGRVGLIMGWQNMRPIADRLDRLYLFRRCGVRIMQPTYNLRNFMGDGCLEADDGGLSALGKRAVGLMNRIGIAVDLSHVGERATIQAAEISDRPVLVTHANARSVTASPRNKSDEAIRAVAASGGTIGVSIYGPMCWDGRPEHRPMLDDFFRHLDHVAGLVGAAHVALGTDLPAVTDLAAVSHITEMTRDRFPGVIERYASAFGNDIRDRYLGDCGCAADLVRITEALVRKGWPEHDIRGLLGRNLIDALARAWGE